MNIAPTGVVFAADEMYILLTSITTTDGLDSVVTPLVMTGGNQQLQAIEGFDASPNLGIGISLGSQTSLQRIELPTALRGGIWPEGNLCTVITPVAVGDEFCQRVRTEVPMCGTPENPQPAVLVTGCPP